MIANGKISNQLNISFHKKKIKSVNSLDIRLCSQISIILLMTLFRIQFYFLTEMLYWFYEQI